MVIVIALVVALLLAPTAGADVGFESASRSSAAPGEQVKLAIGCGFCFPPCVGRPGHRHPPGTTRGICMLDSRSRPPTGFGIWLTPATHPLDRQGPTRPPRLPSFTYLGRAERASPRNGPGQHRIPRYVLGFHVPALPPGPYEYVLYCAACIDGPRGTLVESVPGPVGQLQVRASAAAGGDAHAWLAGIAVIFGVPALVLFLRRRLRR